MKLKQLIGPFSQNAKQYIDEDNGGIILNLTNIVYLQIGVEHPHSAPISEIDWDNENNFITLAINELESNFNNTILEDTNQRRFILSDKDILEFYYNRSRIHLHIWDNNNPYLIVNIAYKTAD